MDLVIVGAGISGAATAHYLAGSGLRIALLDSSLPGTEASGRNAGTLLLQSDHIKSVPFVLRAYEMWDRLSETLKYDLEVRRHGGLRVAESPAEVAKVEELASRYRSLGADVRVLAGQDLRALAPYLNAKILAASYCPGEGSANPRVVGSAFARSAERQGVSLHWRAPVTKIAVGEDGYQVVSAAGTWTASKVLLAAGPWTPVLASGLGIQMPTHVRHLQVHATEPIPRLLPQIVTRVAGRLTLKQVAAGNVLIGGGWPGEERSPGEVRTESLATMRGNLAMAVDVVPDLRRVRIIRSWTGFEHTSPDHYPIFGTVPGLEGVYLLTAARGGFVAGPLLGSLMAQLIRDGSTEMDVGEFDIRRFDGEREGSEGAQHVV